MANISAALVKELRERTAAGMMDCKKALEEANGDIELAIENMRKSGQAKAAKKAGRIAAEGVIFARTEGNVAVMIELNCETDFVSKDAGFLAMGQKIVEIAATQKIADVDALKAADFGNGESVELTITNLIAKIDYADILYIAPLLFLVAVAVAGVTSYATLRLYVRR